MKTAFVFAVFMLIVVLGVSFWVTKRRAIERERFDTLGPLYKAREEAALKERSKEPDAVTKIIPPAGAPVATPAASPAPSTLGTPAGANRSN